MIVASENFLQATVRAMSWTLVQQLGTRVVTLLGQLVLGWLLLPADFGVYALALSITNAIGALRNGGVAPLLSRHISDHELIERKLTAFALVFNVIAALLTIALAPLAALHFHSDQLAWLVVWIAFSFPAGTWAVSFRCRLAVEGRYRELSILGIASTLFWQIGTVSMALNHFGAYSYVVPTALQGLFETLLAYAFIKRWPRVGGHLNYTSIKAVFRETRWIMLGAATLSLATTGDYFAVGLSASMEMLGRYFFAFQLLAAVANAITGGIETALPPLLSRFDQERDRQTHAVLDLLQICMLVTLPLTGLVSIAASPAIHLLWHGKWDSTSGALSIMAFCLPAWVLVSITRAVLESRGHWRSRLLLLGPYGAGAVLSAGYGARDSLEHLAATMTGFYVLFAAGLVFALAHIVNRPAAQLLTRMLLPPLLANFVCLGFAYGLAHVVQPQASSTAWLAVGFFVAISLISQFTVLGSIWRATFKSWRHLSPSRTEAPVLPRAAHAD
jgi:O-antigen/teichoic acid export membrane protein